LIYASYSNLAAFAAWMSDLSLANFVFSTLSSSALALAYSSAFSFSDYSSLTFSAFLVASFSSSRLFSAFSFSCSIAFS